MPLEIERKYLHPDLTRLRHSLPLGGAMLKQRAWEENLVLDTPARMLRRTNMLLRLRHTGTTTLTLKKPVTGSAEGRNVKTMEELETVVADKTAMLAIFKQLGFMIAFKYEKFRETWQWKNCTICLDILPFMEAVELEGDLGCIDEAEQYFGLNSLEASTLTYHQLHQLHCRNLGLPPTDDFVFSPEQKIVIATSISSAEKKTSPSSQQCREKPTIGQKIY